MKSKGSAPFAQVCWPWLSLLLTTALLVGTALYASRPGIFSAAGYTTKSISAPVRNLRILSGVTDLLLAATFSSILERVQWALIARQGGLTFLDTLTFHASTGYLGAPETYLWKRR